MLGWVHSQHSGRGADVTIQTAQLARDEKKLAKATLRERPALKRSVDERRAGEAK
jgi:hypothetical protein